MIAFRKKATESQRSSWQGKAVAYRGIPTWLVAIFTLLFFILMAAFLLWGTWHRRVVVTGELVSVPRAVTIYSHQQ